MTDDRTAEGDPEDPWWAAALFVAVLTMLMVFSVWVVFGWRP